jgi:hypothetical protein
MHQESQVLAEKIRTLTPEQIDEVEDFIESLRLRGEGRGLTRAASAVSAPAFEAIWSNAEDDAYDAI